MPRPRNEMKNIRKDIYLPESIETALQNYCTKLSIKEGREITDKDIILSAIIIYLKKEGVKLAPDAIKTEMEGQVKG